MPAHPKKTEEREGRWRWGGGVIIITDLNSLCLSITFSLRWVCVFESRPFAFSAALQPRPCSLASLPAEGRGQPTQVAHFKHKHTKTCYFNWPSSHQAVNDLSSVLWVVFSFSFSKAGCMVMNIWFRAGEQERESEWNDMPRHLASQVFLAQVRQPAAFMEMDGAEGGTMAAALPPPAPPPSSRELESTLIDLVFLC